MTEYKYWILVLRYWDQWTFHSKTNFFIFFLPCSGQSPRRLNIKIQFISWKKFPSTTQTKLNNVFHKCWEFDVTMFHWLPIFFSFFSVWFDTHYWGNYNQTFNYFYFPISYSSFFNSRSFFFPFETWDFLNRFSPGFQLLLHTIGIWIMYCTYM